MGEKLMDKDTLRMIVFLSGLLLIAGMIAWSFFQHQKDQREFEKYHEEDLDDPFLADEYQAKFDVFSSALKKTTEFITEPFKNKTEVNSETVKEEPPVLPELIQLSIIAPTSAGFNGEDIFKVLTSVDLKYGNLQIFERLDADQLVDFSVANIVNPGTFPKANLADFSCPGLSFFMQPQQVNHPSEVFEDFVRTLNFVALKLAGDMIDNERQPLTDENLQQIRQKF
jgi:cell division protein ZipA